MVILLPFLAQLVAAAPRTPLPAPAAGATKATVHSNRVAAGTLAARTLTLAIDVVESAWKPDGSNDPEVPILAFAEAGKIPTVPGPLMRVARGTIVVLTLRNRTDSALVIGGLRPGAGVATDTIQLAKGAAREVRYTLGREGTFSYWGAFAGSGAFDRLWKDSQLNGAIVVDAPGVVVGKEEILLLSEWFYDHGDARAWEIASVINGKGWPHTETLQYTQGDSVRVRVINATALSHPLHLHGFYYRITSRGDGATDSSIPLSRRPLSNTDIIRPGHTTTFDFAASTPGNWLFHCHFAFHVDETVTLSGAPMAPGGPAHAEHGAAKAEHMRGLAVGIKVAPKAGYAAPSTAGARDMRLFVQRKRGVLPGRTDAIGFALQQDDVKPALDSVVLPGPVLELTRGKPVNIVIQNNLDEPTSVHWHGLEIESFPDGVPHWSGLGDNTYGQIDPGSSFTASFVPPRSGTFPYHSHFNDRKQITSGMYGALIVSDAPRDTTHDHLVVVGGGGPWVDPKNESPYGLVNGRRAPRSIRMFAGDEHRLRIVTIHPDWLVELTLRSDSAVARWQPIAKDGADLPPALRTTRRAHVTMGPGETGDYIVRPLQPGRYTLEVRTEDSGGWAIQVPVIVEQPVRARRAP